MTVKSIQSLVNSAMQEIKTITANEAYEMLEGNNCNLIDIREINELENTGRPKIPSTKYKQTVDVAIFGPKVIPNNKTTKVCMVIGTG